MTPRHHARMETLLDFAAGRLDGAMATVVAAHAARCERCAAHISEAEALGGAVLSDSPAVAMSADALDRVWREAGGPSGDDATARAPSGADAFDRFSTLDLSAIAWRPMAPGVAHSVLRADGYRKNALRLLKVKPGTTIPRHSHRGEELTIILRGAYRDDGEDYHEGDMADLVGDHEHEPRAIGDQPCICLIATNAPLIFKSLGARLAQPFIGF